MQSFILPILFLIVFAAIILLGILRPRLLSWRRFAFLFAMCQVALFLVGCSAAWIGALQGMIPTISGIVSAVVSFIAALEGKTVSASFNAAVQKWSANISDLLSQLSTLVKSAASSTTSTLISQIQAVMAQLSTQLSSILQDTGVTDPSTVAKLEEFVQLAIAAVNAILAIIPVALARMKAGAPLHELEVVDQQAKDNINAEHSLVKRTYHSIVTTQTTRVEVNAALAALPQNVN